MARILLAEDDGSMLEFLTQALEKADHDVTATNDGLSALEELENGEKFDLLLTDIVMPGRRQGTDLAKELRERTPDLPAIFLSGYAAEATVHGNGLRPDDIRLMKPVARRDLLLAVEKAIASKNNRTS